MEDNFSPEQSLRVIQTMIDRTKTSVADNSFYFLLWGWLVFTGAVLQYILVVLVHSWANGAAWLVMFIGFIVSIIRKVKHKDRPVRTYVDEGLVNIWTAVTIVQVLIVFVFFKWEAWQYCYAFFILLYSIGGFLTGRLLNFPPLIWGAITCWALAILTTFVDTEANMLIMAAAVLLGYIIPGYLLKRDYKMKLINQPH